MAALGPERRSDRLERNARQQGVSGPVGAAPASPVASDLSGDYWAVLEDMVMRIAVAVTLYAGALIGCVGFASGCKASVPGEKPGSVKPKRYEPPDERIVFFAPGRAEVSAQDGFFALGYVAALLDVDPGLHVLIVGHAANEASPTFARDLSFRRARSVRQILAGHGVAPQRMLVAAPREQQRTTRPVLNQRADVYLYDPLEDEISQRLGYTVELRME